MQNDTCTSLAASNNVENFPVTTKSGVLAYLHVTLVIFVAVHLVYFIFMLTRHSFARKNPQKVKKPENMRKINESCSICLENLINESQLLCSHSFCAKCIITYMSQIKTFNVVCPMCRKESQLIFAQFDRSEENKELYNQILSYNHDWTSNYSTSFCFCVDVWKVLSLYLCQLTDLSNSNYSVHRKGAMTVVMLVLFTILYPITQEYNDPFEFLEDFFYYIVFVCCLSEYFYKNSSSRFGALASSTEQSSNRSEM